MDVTKRGRLVVAQQSRLGWVQVQIGGQTQARASRARPRKGSRPSRVDARPSRGQARPSRGQARPSRGQARPTRLGGSNDHTTMTMWSISRISVPNGHMVNFTFLVFSELQQVFIGLSASSKLMCSLLFKFSHNQQYLCD